MPLTAAAMSNATEVAASLQFEEHRGFRDPLGGSPCRVNVGLLPDFIGIDGSRLPFEFSLHDPEEHQGAHFLADHGLRPPGEGIQPMPSLGFAVGRLDAPPALNRGRQWLWRHGWDR